MIPTIAKSKMPASKPIWAAAWKKQKQQSGLCLPSLIRDFAVRFMGS